MVVGVCYHQGIRSHTARRGKQCASLTAPRDLVLQGYSRLLQINDDMMHAVVDEVGDAWRDLIGPL
jgi:hypothetical protein